MFSWIGNLFGTAKAVDNLVDKDNGLLVRAGTALGNLHYSSQEKAIDDLKTKEWGIRQLEALAPFKVMQRIMVTIIVVQWAILFNTLIIAIVLEAATIQKNLFAFAQTDYAWWPMASAVTLYLLGGVWPRKGQS